MWFTRKRVMIIIIIWDTSDQLIPNRRPDWLTINKKKKKKEDLPNSGFCSSDGPQSENQRKHKNKKNYLDLAWELIKLWDMRVIVIPIVIGTVSRDFMKGVGIFGNWRKNWDNLNYSIIKIGHSGWGESLKLEETCCHSDFIERSANAGVKNLRSIIIIIIIIIIINKKKRELAK